MVGSKLEKEIISIFNRDISTLLSINQISKKLKKSYPNINNKVNSLIKEGILTKLETGRSYLCTINLENEKAIALLTINEADKKKQYEKKINLIKEEINDIKNKFKVYTILLHNTTLIFVLDYLNDKEAIKNLYENIKKFDLIFFDKTSFQQYLIKNPNLLNEFIIIYSYEKYYELVNEIKNNLILNNKKVKNKD
ncbi:MAG: hypothetical protein QXE31_02060 [Candidatus Woesearchaeota archaeon]